jgi:hypothetical protein
MQWPNRRSSNMVCKLLNLRNDTTHHPEGPSDKPVTTTLRSAEPSFLKNWVLGDSTSSTYDICPTFLHITGFHRAEFYVQDTTTERRFHHLDAN